MLLKAAIYATPGYGRRLGATDVIEHAESNCTIAASKPTPMVILSLGHSASTVTALQVSHGDVVGASDLVETTPYAQAETVLNYEEVAARLAPTAYAHLLH